VIKVLLSNNISQVWVNDIISFVIFLTGKICFSSILVLVVVPMTFSSIVIIPRFPPRALLDLFEYTVFLKMAYFIASLASYINTPSRIGNRISFLFSFEK